MNNWLSNESNKGAYDGAWDETATSGCPKGPPKVDNATCTPEGCNERIYGYKGVIVSTGRTDKAQQEYFDYVEIQKGKDCAEALKTLSDANPPTHTGVDGIPIGKCDSDVYWFYRGEEVSADTWKLRMCAENKKNLLDTIHSGPIQYCDISPIYICGGEEILKDGSRDQAKANFDKCLAENKDAQCTQALNEDAKTKGKGGPHTSPTPEGMEPIVGKHCAAKYYYCPESGKIYMGADAAEEYEDDESCQGPDCSTMPKKCKKNKHKSKPECSPYKGCW